MERRDLLKGLSAAGFLSLLDPATSPLGSALARQDSAQPVPRRAYGRAKDQISVIGFGGIVVKDMTPEDAARHVSEAVDRGVNYFDVAPTYGNAQERLVPPSRRIGINASWRARRPRGMRRGAAGTGGVAAARCRPTTSTSTSFTPSRPWKMSTEPSHRAGRWRSSSKPRNRARSATSVSPPTVSKPPMRRWDRYDFDSILFPLSFPVWIKEGFGPSVHKRALEGEKGILALKAMAHQKWTVKQEDRKWNKAWYEPFDQIDKVSLGVHERLAGPCHDPAWALGTLQHGGELAQVVAAAQRCRAADGCSHRQEQRADLWKADVTLPNGPPDQLVLRLSGSFDSPRGRSSRRDSPWC